MLRRCARISQDLDLNADDFAPGELQSVDGYMNIALEGTREFVDGKMRRSYGDAFVRGNNGMCGLSISDFAFLLRADFACGAP